MIRTASNAPHRKQADLNLQNTISGAENPYDQRVTDESLSRLGQQCLLIVTLFILRRRDVADRFQ